MNIALAHQAIKPSRSGRSAASPMRPKVGPLLHLLRVMTDVRCAITDTHHRYLYVNEAWLRCFGCRDASNVLGRTLSDLYPRWRAKRTIAEEKEILEHGATLDYAELSLNAEGQLERWRTMKAPWIDAGRIQGIVTIGVQLTASATLESRKDDVPEIVDYLARRACKAVTISQIAEELGMSTRTFQRRFHQIMRETPVQFRMRCRIAAGRQRLRQNQPIAFVARACGFRDQSHFTSSFARLVGMSPGRYQKEALAAGVQAKPRAKAPAMPRAFEDRALAQAVLTWNPPAVRGRAP